MSNEIRLMLKQAAYIMSKIESDLNNKANNKKIVKQDSNEEEAGQVQKDQAKNNPILLKNSNEDFIQIIQNTDQIKKIDPSESSQQETPNLQEKIPTNNNAELKQKVDVSSQEKKDNQKKTEESKEKDKNQSDLQLNKIDNQSTKKPEQSEQKAEKTNKKSAEGQDVSLPHVSKDKQETKTVIADKGDKQVIGQQWPAPKQQSKNVIENNSLKEISTDKKQVIEDTTKQSIQKSEQSIKSISNGNAKVKQEKDLLKQKTNSSEKKKRGSQKLDKSSEIISQSTEKEKSKDKKIEQTHVSIQQEPTKDVVAEQVTKKDNKKTELMKEIQSESKSHPEEKDQEIKNNRKSEKVIVNEGNQTQTTSNYQVIEEIQKAKEQIDQKKQNVRKSVFSLHSLTAIENDNEGNEKNNQSNEIEKKLNKMEGIESNGISRKNSDQKEQIRVEQKSSEKGFNQQQQQQIPSTQQIEQREYERDYSDNRDDYSVKSRRITVNSAEHNQNVNSQLPIKPQLINNKESQRMLKDHYLNKSPITKPILRNDQSKQKILCELFPKGGNQSESRGSTTNKFRELESQKHAMIREANKKKRELELQLMNVNREIDSIHKQKVDLPLYFPAEEVAQQKLMVKLESNIVHNSKLVLPPLKKTNQFKDMLRIQSDTQASQEAIKLINKMKKEKEEKQLKKDMEFAAFKKEIQTNLELRKEKNGDLFEKQVLERRQKALHRLNQKDQKRQEELKLVEASKGFLKELNKLGPNSVALKHQKQVAAVDNEFKFGEYRMPELDAHKLGLEQIRSLRKGDFNGGGSMPHLVLNRKYENQLLKNLIEESNLLKEKENGVSITSKELHKKRIQYSKSVQKGMLKAQANLIISRNNNRADTSETLINNDDDGFEYAEITPSQLNKSHAQNEEEIEQNKSNDSRYVK